MSETATYFAKTVLTEATTAALTLPVVAESFRPEQWDSPLPVVPFLLNSLHSLVSSTTNPEGSSHWLMSRLTEFAVVNLFCLLLNPLPDETIQSTLTTTLGIVGSLGLLKTIWHTLR